MPALTTAAYAFPKAARLLTKTAFQQVFDRANKVSDPFLTLLVAPNHSPSARLGLAISRKCARRAVDRNRIKRLLRGTFRQTRMELPQLDFVVLCRPAAVTCPNAVLCAAFTTLLAKSSVRYA